MSHALLLFDNATAIRRTATLSPNGRYRYHLARTWGPATPRVLFVMLNPSTADADVDDATIRVCVGRAERLGCHGIEVVNLFALRATDPRELLRADDPIGPANDLAIMDALASVDVRFVVAAWGAAAILKAQACRPNRAPHRAEAVQRMIRAAGHESRCLGRTRGGQPRHPLRVPYARPLEPFAPDIALAAPEGQP